MRAFSGLPHRQNTAGTERGDHVPQKTAYFGNKESASGHRFRLGSVSSTVPKQPLKVVGSEILIPTARRAWGGGGHVRGFRAQRAP